MNSKETPNQLQGKFNHQEITRDFLKHELRQFEKQTGSGPHSSKEHITRERELWSAELSVESTKNKLAQSQSEFKHESWQIIR
jgi:hypothetical protein